MALPPPLDSGGEGKQQRVGAQVLWEPRGTPPSRFYMMHVTRFIQISYNP